MKLWTAVLLTSLTLSHSASRAQVNPARSYRVLRSPHFEIIYQEEQKDLAKRYALAAEQAHELLTPIFKEMPSKTLVVIKDDTDLANGLATFLPYPHIVVYPVLPTTLDSIDEYGDWPLEMMLHEYTHILNMYPAHSFYWPFKYIFGTVVRPNAILPIWYLEGLAVDTESWFSTHGRLRSIETHAAARALTLGGKFKEENIGRINEQGIKSWPYGGRPYMYGGWWWENLHREKGKEVIETLNQNYSRRIPYFINGPLEDQTGQSAQGLLNATFENLEGHARRQIEAITKAGTQSSSNAVEEGSEQSIFAISPNGNRLVYWLSDPEQGSVVRLRTRISGNEPWSSLTSERLFKTKGVLRVRWLSDDRFLFDQLDNYSPYTNYRDLYTYDVVSGKTERLTHDARAQEPSPSPSRDKIAFIQPEGGKSKLMLLEMKTGQIRTLLRGNLNQRLSGPEFISDHEIIVSVRQKNGDEKLQRYNLNTKQVGLWNAQLNSAQNTRWTSAGVLATDAKTGARNAYLVSDKVAQAVSNTQTDIPVADYDPIRKELVFSELTPVGRRLKTMPFKNFQPPTIALNQLPPPPVPTTTKVSIVEENYQPIAYMWPRYWIPFIYQVEGGILFQGLTANQDPAGINQYEVMASFDSVTKKPSYGAAYVNNSWPVAIGASYQKAVSYLGASGVIVESSSTELNLGSFWPFNSKYLRWQLGGVSDHIEGEFATYDRMGPQATLSWSPIDNSLHDRWGFQLDLVHQQFLEGGDQLAYGRSYVGIANNFRLWGQHRLFIQTRGAVSPDMPSRGTVVDLGDRSVGGNYLVNLANSLFLLRGYPSGAFVGRRIVNANVEYIFPLVDLNRDFGSFPLFIRNLEVAFFADTMAVDGYAFDKDLAFTRSKLGEFYMGTGSELRFSTTTGFHLPLQFTLGLYYGFQDRFGGGLSTFFGIGFGGLGPLGDKTP